MSDTFNVMVRRTVDEALDAGATDIATICDRIEREHPESLAAHGQMLAVKGLRQKVKALLRAFTEDDETQLTLPGLHFPGVLAFPQDEGAVGYIRTDQARWVHFEAGEQLREENVQNAVAKLRIYRAGKEFLRPYLEYHPERTFTDALRLAREEGAA